MLTDGVEALEGSGLDVVVGDIRDRSSLTPSLFKVSGSLFKGRSKIEVHPIFSEAPHLEAQYTLPEN